MTALPANFADPSCDATCCTAPPRAMPWLRLAIGVFVAAQTMLIGMAVNLSPPEDTSTRKIIDGGLLVATLAVLLLLGGPMVGDAVTSLKRRRISMELLFLTGIAAAMGISLQSMRLGRGPVYFDVVSVLLTVYSAGRSISQHSRRRAMDAVNSMRHIAPTARVLTPSPGTPDFGELSRAGEGWGEGSASNANHPKNEKEPSPYPLPAYRERENRPIASVRIGDVVRVNPGELIPVDGVIVDGESFVRQTPFTGELVSRAMKPGDTVASGAGVEDGSLLIRATADGGQRKLDRLIDLVTQAAASPPALQRQADRFVQWFLPIVMAMAIGAFVYWTRSVSLERGLYAGLAVLLVACPCAAGLATPLTLWVTLSRLAKLGLIATSGDAIECLATAESVVFDKTGTLADERLTIAELHWLPLPPGEGWGEGQAAQVARNPSDRQRTLPITLTLSRRERGPERVLAMVAAVERQSTHPVARALTALSDDTAVFELLQSRTLPARGVEGVLLDRERNTRHTVRLERDRTSGATLRITAVIDDTPTLRIDLTESLRPTAIAAIDQLRTRGMAVHIMTGDASAGPATPLAPSRNGMTPQDKWTELKQFHRPLFVGDGVNDAPALAAAHASIALAGGSTLAVATASATLHGADLTVIPRSIDLARQAVVLIRSNLRWAFAYNLIGVLLAAGGYLHPILAAVLMGASSAFVSFRSLREVKTPASTPRTPIEGSEEDSLHSTIETSIYPLFINRFLAKHRSKTLLIGWMLQAALLIPILALSPLQSAGLLIVFYWIAYRVNKAFATAADWMDMSVAMLAVGGMGMNLGWWADLDFAWGDPAATECCHTAAGLLGLPWMYLGMIALGTPAMYVLRRSPVRFSWRRWCCVGPIVLGIPGMVGGMWIGSLAAGLLAQNISRPWNGLIDYALMSAGMFVGMLLPHAFEWRSTTPT